MATKRTAEEIQRLLEGYRQRTGTRAEYCRQQGISLHTLAYCVARYARPAHPRLARVKLASPVAPSARFTLLLRNGRRIESAWNFRDADLARLIRIAESE
jgi:hypothetical protein